MTTNKPQRGLGRGLDALLPAAPPMSNYGDKSVFTCGVEKIVPQKGQPRRHFEPQALAELAQSIKEHGIIEPIVVRRVGTGGTFEIIAGERRWRAAQKAGLKDILVVVKDVSPADAFELAIVENVQRADLGAIELAEAYDRLLREHDYTQESLATRLGKDRSTIANTLRLLKLPPRVRDKVVSGELSEGHARALLGAADANAIADLAEKVLRGKLSVRQTEALVRAKGPKAKAASANGAAVKSPAIRDLETRLTRALGTKVEVRDVGNKGELAIAYADLDALDRIVERLGA
ncbi:MAG: ParB/RepB/Spo0J family partition protein [Polyangiaceae bacterium]